MVSVAFKMLNYNPKTNIRSLETLHTLCKTMAILPPVNLCNVEDYKSKYLYGSAAACLLLFSYVYTIYGKIVYVQKTMSVTGFVIDVGSDLTLIVANLISIVGINLMNGNIVSIFLTNMKKIDIDFQYIPSESKHPNIRFVMEMVLIHIYMIIFFTYNLYTWMSTLGMHIYKFFFLKDFQSYYIIVLAMLLRNYAYAIKYRMEVLNGILTRGEWSQTNNICANYSGSASAKIKTKQQWTLKKITKQFTNLTNLIDLYNKIFGWQFVSLYIVIVFNLLLPINLALIYGSGEKDIDGFKYGSELVIVCIMRASLPIITALAIFSACNHATDEIKLTSVISYNLIQELGEVPNDLNYKQELQELALLATNKCPSFSAAGFFAVNYSALFGLVGSITSYLIVLIQFNK
ncbi:PREDICTED: putative gustatory receptor 28b [Nicrophorus vespilloides]|uniref:Gustatory receptor n=1 Tax=Nicrophorus vespilloides TaxID=110193 RepID=A0ABM1MN74_NICVS|nr:PREDICTED: putative gustatory receptor 28b [Nicrophorus vespilloides]